MGMVRQSLGARIGLRRDKALGNNFRQGNTSYQNTENCVRPFEQGVGTNNAVGANSASPFDVGVGFNNATGTNFAFPFDNRVRFNRALG